jgi:O-antigen ligase
VIFLILAGILVIGAVVVAVVKLFIRWEREGKEHLAPLVLIGLLVVEATIYADQNTLPRGLFHPGSGSTQLRLPEIYITLALLARLIARGRPKRIGLPAGLWLAFGAWLVVGIVEGELYHNAFSQNLYEAKDILYVVGAYALAAGVPLRRYLDSGDLLKLGWLTVACASVVDVMTIGGLSINTNLPLLPLQNFGTVGAETAALCIAVGIMCFIPRMLAGPVRLRDFLALVPALGAVVLANQRAVLVNVAIVVAVLVLVPLFGHRKSVSRRPHVTSGHVLLALLAIIAVVIAVLVVPAAVDQKPVRVPLATTFQNLFHSEGKAESAQDRLNLASEAEKLIPQHPIIGWGLGVEFPFYEAGTRAVQQTAYAHDIALDLLLRLGLIGLLLFFFAFLASFIGGVQVWRRHPDPMVAGLALALLAVLAGLLATGFLEPFLDEYRLATLFGVSLGILRACVTSMGPSLPRWAERSDMSAAKVEAGDALWT